MKELSVKKLLPLEIVATVLYAATVFAFGFNPETTAPWVFTFAWGGAIVACILYVIFFYFKRLYSDMVEMTIYTPLNIIGLCGILFYSSTFGGVELPIPVLAVLLFSIGFGLLASWGSGKLAIGLHKIKPTIFPYPNSVGLDAYSTGLSYIATILLIMWNPLTWLFWLVINILSIAVYWKNKAYVLMGAYILYFFNAIRGIIEWGTIPYLLTIFGG